MGNAYHSYFNDVYNTTHLNVQKYIASKFYDLHEIEDILQDVYLEFYKTLCKFGINYITKPESFLITVAKKKLARRYSLRIKLKSLFSLTKTNDQDEEYTRCDFSDIAGSYNDVPEDLIDRETVEEVWQIINTKDIETIEIFRLRYLEELQIDEISEKMKLPEHTVKNKLYRALEQIRATLGDSVYTSI